ncbi:MAG: Gfo/Idh/MocA family oxidoreductase [Pirellulales bacterium]|nr:Gfo/Idh/MocA family oxidoreductase [Pirellulales bacterium]
MPETLRAAVIGRTGRGDYGHALDTVWLRAPNAKLVAVADDGKMGLAQATRRLSVERGYLDYREMLDREKPQIVSVAPRWIDAHAEMIVACAERGIHVFTEKPLCRTLAEADAIVTACERTHTKLAIAYQTRYSPKLPVVAGLLRAGRIGRVLEYRARGKEDQRGGGEDLFVLGGHLFNLIRHLAGEPSWCFAQVSEQGESIARQHVHDGAEGIGPLAGDSVDAMYGLSGDATAYFASHRGAAAKPARFGIQIFGTAGILEIQTGWMPTVRLLEDSSWSPGRSGAKWQEVTSAGVGKPEPMPAGGPEDGNLAAIADLMESIENDRQPLASVYEARGVMEMIVAPFASAVQGGRVALPLAVRDNPLTRL